MRTVLSSKAWIPAGLALVLAAVNHAVWQKETLISDGKTVLLQLAPVDPRSLMQGDYMRLGYALTGALPREGGLPTHSVRLKLDEKSVGTRIDPDSGGPLAADEARMILRRRGMEGWRIGSDAFFFQEGTATLYTQARYGEYRTSFSGDSVLIALRDEHLRRIGVNRLEHPWRVPRALAGEAH